MSMTAPIRSILVTGAGGNLGQKLIAGLVGQGWCERIVALDRAIPPTANNGPDKVQWVEGDLAGAASSDLRDAFAGVDAVVHFAAQNPYPDAPWTDACASFDMTLNMLAAAAQANVRRVVFASSNHSIGFHERPGGNEAKLDADCAFRPDGYYGLSKAYGELMGRLYWDKHGVENVNLRIGSCFPEPTDARMLSTWLSYADLVRLVRAAVAAPRTGHCVIWACSHNPATFWGDDHRERIGWRPRDTAEAHRAQAEGKLSGDPVVERYQGGGYTAMDYTRDRPSPRDAFALD